ncbi:MAG: hypothetical protein BRC50_02680 [Cyanobacteria bacterium SW_11_48_12]|nr:MAG: hypothetical protein BRC50_02680 [Cyanobacteria bacterium SW_11_48_12]
MKSTFPNSKFLAIIRDGRRDGRAVFSSQKNSIYSRTGRPFQTNPYRAAKAWCKMVDILKEIKREYPQESLVIYYENLIRNREKTMELVCDFLDVSKNSSGQGYVVPERYGELHKNVGKEPIQSKITAWQQLLSKKEVKAFESVAHEKLLSEGYELVNHNKSNPKMQQFNFSVLSKMWDKKIQI